MTPRFILASTSPTRRKLLEAAGIPCLARSPQIDESVLKHQWRHRPVSTLALDLAKAKALSLTTSTPHIVLAADQTLLANGKAYGKPTSLAEARNQLLELRGKTHILQSALAIAEDNLITWTHVGEARLTMRNFTDAFLDAYLAGTGTTILDSVGCYKLEQSGITLFESVAGDYFTILGLPLLPLLAVLRDKGLLPS